MLRDITISFRTSGELRDSLRKVAEGQRKSVSLVIEGAILKYLQEKKAGPAREKRRYPRRVISLPALVSLPRHQVCSAMVLDVSLGGLRLSLPRDVALEVREQEAGVHLDVHFPIPNEKRPVLVTCKPERLDDGESTAEIGASFVECNFSEYCRLRNYLV